MERARVASLFFIYENQYGKILIGSRNRFLAIIIKKDYLWRNDAARQKTSNLSGPVCETKEETGNNEEEGTG
jgi:hypothetical protein